MSRHFFLAIFTLIFSCSFSYGQQKPLIIEGGIGKYPIDMKITASDPENGTFEGVYNYRGHKNKLNIQGEVFGDCILITESFKGKETGEFYLEAVGDELKGKWLDSSRWFSVDLKIISGDRSMISRPSLEERYKDLSNEITGTYKTEYYFINDMWFREDQPNIELGYNGGIFAVEEFAGDSLAFAFEVICGPTYHFAIGEGIAYKSGDSYICQMYEECLLEISVEDKKIKAVAHGSSVDCGFGARAYLDDVFIKTSETYTPLEEH